jgi:hypothetical protein
LNAFLLAWFAVIALLPGQLAAALPARTAYVFTLIADTRGPLDSISPALSINHAGMVAFGAAFKGGGGGAMAGDGGVPRTIATRSGSGYGATINDAGTVAFVAESADGGRGLYAGNGGPLTTIAVGNIRGNPRINNKGAVVFLAVGWPSAGPGDGILVGSGGPLARISDRGEGGFLNDQGIAVFVMQTGSGAQGLYTGNGGRPNLVAIAAPGGPFAGFNPSPVINNRGVIAFTAWLADGGNAVYRAAGGKLTAVADTQGPFARFDYVSMNAGGAVAFDAELKGGGKGIFTGPDPAAHKVIATGEPLFGARVTDISFFREGLNDQGQVAFHAVLDDGRQVVVRASP